MITVAGGDRPWVIVFPLASNAPVQTYDAQRPVSVDGANAPMLICAGADRRATICERLLDGATGSNRDFVLNEGRHVKGQCFVGRRTAANATVRIRPAEVEARRALTLPLARGANDWVKAVRTGDSGWYEIEHLAPGKYIVEITTKGGRIEESEVIEIPPLKATIPDRPPPSRMFLLPKFHFEDGVNLVVEIRLTDGTPIPKASVEVSQPATGRTARLLAGASNDEGVAELEGINAAVPGRVSCVARGFTRFEATFDTMPNIVTCALDRLAMIKGTVVDGQRAPAPATVELRGAYRTVATDGAGVFTFEAVTPGRYEILASSSTGVSVRIGTISSGETLDLGEVLLGETRTVQGRVVDATTGNAIVGASLMAIDPPGASAVTDAEGAFAISCDTEIQTQVRVAADGYASAESVLGLAPTIRLSRPGSLDIAAWEDETGEPCAGCTIVAYYPSGAVSGITNTAGQVRLGGLAPGDYQVSRDRITYSSRGVTVSGGADSQIVSVLANETTHVEIGSQRRLVQVLIDPPPSAELALRALGPRRVVTATVSRPGSFTFRARPTEAYSLRLDATRSGVVVGQVDAGFSGQSLLLQLGNSDVQLRITKNEAPAADALVRLVSSVGAPVGWAVTDANGSATISCLRPGLYSAVVDGRSLGTVSVVAGRTAVLTAAID